MLFIKIGFSLFQYIFLNVNHRAPELFFLWKRKIIEQNELNIGTKIKGNNSTDQIYSFMYVLKIFLNTTVLMHFVPAKSITRDSMVEK